MKFLIVYIIIINATLYTYQVVVDAFLISTGWSARNQEKKALFADYDYDMVVIGAGASGMFAAGTASGFGCRTLLVEKYDVEQVESADEFYLGGDCTNSACVPSKAAKYVCYKSLDECILISSCQELRIFVYSDVLQDLRHWLQKRMNTMQ